MRNISKFLILLLALSSCGNLLKKKYANGQAAWDSVKDVKYADIIKVWGEPDERIAYADRVDLVWSNSKVAIDEGNLDGEIILSFDKYYDQVYMRFEGMGVPHDMTCGEWQYLPGHKMKIHKVPF